MTMYYVSIRTLNDLGAFTPTRPKFDSETEARAYAAWLLAKEPNLITDARVLRGRDGRANASFHKSKAVGAHGGRLVWWDDQPGDEPSRHHITQMDRQALLDALTRSPLKSLQDGVSVAGPRALPKPH
jgi:hypothetical protein